MASIDHHRSQTIWWPKPWILLGRHLLLVPEAALLPSLLCLHIAFGQPPLVALAGLLLSGLFVLRTLLLLLAGMALDAGRYARAERLARWALRLYPFSADGLALRGQARRARGELQLAASDLARASSLYPGHSRLHAELSSTLAGLGQGLAARGHALYALLLAPRTAAGYTQLAELALTLDSAPREAAYLAGQGLRLARQPADQARLQVLLAEAQAALGQQQLVWPSIHSATALLESCPAELRAALLYRLGQLRWRLHDLDGAARALRHVASCDPEGRFVGMAWRASQQLAVQPAVQITS